MKRDGEKGAAAIEFALVGLMLVTLLLSGLDFSRVFATSISVENAARAGVAYGLRNEANSANVAVIEKAATEAAAGNHLQDFQATARQRRTANREYVEVTAQAALHTMGVYPFLPNPMILKSTVSMRSR
jgi:Flp pilus assembly protein TadG